MNIETRKFRRILGNVENYSFLDKLRLLAILAVLKHINVFLAKCNYISYEDTFWIF